MSKRPTSIKILPIRIDSSTLDCGSTQDILTTWEKSLFGLVPRCLLPQAWTVGNTSLSSGQSLFIFSSAKCQAFHSWRRKQIQNGGKSKPINSTKKILLFSSHSSSSLKKSTNNDFCICLLYLCRKFKSISSCWVFSWPSRGSIYPESCSTWLNASN